MTHDLAATERLMLSWTEGIGEIARGLFGRTGELRFKFAQEAITEADHRIERLLVERIRDAFPGDAIHGEEFGESGDASSGDGGRTWYLDPVDGTLNFALGLPNFCTSVALMDGDEILAAMVYQPLHEERFTAYRGGGTRLNGEPVRVSERAAVGDSVLSLQLQKRGRFVQNAVLLQQILLQSMKVRRLGTIALEMAYLADGRYDGLLAGRGKPQALYDVAAGILLVEEAGGRVTDHRGRTYVPGSTDLVATNGRFHDEIIALIGEYDPEG